MNAIYSLILLVILSTLVYTGNRYFHLEFLFYILMPYAAFLVFVAGFIKKILYWAKSPVPFNISLTAGQQKSLSWIKSNPVENPSTVTGVLGRLFLEVFFFRSLFRNTRAGMTKDLRPGYASEKSLWLAGLLFHWSFLYIGIRHLRFFMHPVPIFVTSLEKFDSLFQIGLPLLYMTDVVLLLAVTFLFFRRIVIPQVKYISLMADFFPLFVILGIAISGVFMRYFFHIDVAGIKHYTMSLVSLHPKTPENASPVFLIHLFLVSLLLAYIPFSKLMHMGGIFFSPSRNMKGNSRQIRHVNPWNYPVKVHTYEDYEEEYKGVMKNAGLPIDRE